MKLFITAYKTYKCNVFKEIEMNIKNITIQHTSKQKTRQNFKSIK